MPPRSRSKSSRCSPPSTTMTITTPPPTSACSTLRAIRRRWGLVGIRCQGCTFLATTHGRRTIGTYGRLMRATSLRRRLRREKRRIGWPIGRNQGNNIDFGMDIAIPQNRILLRPSHLKLQYTYTVGNNMHPPSGSYRGGNAGAIDYPDVGSQFHELIDSVRVRFARQRRDQRRLLLHQFQRKQFHGGPTWRTSMPSASANSTFLGNTDHWSLQRQCRIHNPEIQILSQGQYSTHRSGHRQRMTVFAESSAH